VDRTLLARLCGALLVISVALQALSYPWPLFLWGIAPTAVSAVTLGFAMQLAVAGVMLLGVAGLLLAQRSQAGMVCGALALAGLALHAVLMLLAFRGSFVALGLHLVGARFAGLFGRGSGVPALSGLADLLALALFTAGLFYSGLAARRDGSLRLWWAPPALGVWNVVALIIEIVEIVEIVAVHVAFSPSPLTLSGIIVSVVAVPLLLWALLGVALLTARGVRQREAVAAQV
jgi:hypothetical protein